MTRPVRRTSRTGRSSRSNKVAVTGFTLLAGGMLGLAILAVEVAIIAVFLVAGFCGLVVLA